MFQDGRDQIRCTLVIGSIPHEGSIAMLKAFKVEHGRRKPHLVKRDSQVPGAEILECSFGQVSTTIAIALPT